MMYCYPSHTEEPQVTYSEPSWKIQEKNMTESPTLSRISVQCKASTKTNKTVQHNTLSSSSTGQQESADWMSRCK